MSAEDPESWGCRPKGSEDAEAGGLCTPESRLLEVGGPSYEVGACPVSLQMAHLILSAW